MSFYGIFGSHIQEAIQGNHYFVSGINSCSFAFTAHSEANKRILLRFHLFVPPLVKFPYVLSQYNRNHHCRRHFSVAHVLRQKPMVFFPTEVCKILITR